MTIFYIVMIAVASIWALVIIIAIFNVLSAIKEGEGKEKADDETAVETITAFTNIAGMPAQTYYATYYSNTTN